MSAQYIINTIDDAICMLGGPHPYDCPCSRCAYEEEMQLCDIAASRASDPDYLGMLAEQAFYASELGNSEDAHPQFCDCIECLESVYSIAEEYYAAKARIEAAGVNWEVLHTMPAPKPRLPYNLGPLCECGHPLVFEDLYQAGTTLMCPNCDLPF